MIRLWDNPAACNPLPPLTLSPSLKHAEAADITHVLGTEASKERQDKARDWCLWKISFQISMFDGGFLRTHRQRESDGEGQKEDDEDRESRWAVMAV